MNDCIAIITARGGSKGLPRKNILDLAGKPLIAHTIIAAKESGCFTRVIVTTDCSEIRKVSLDWGAEVIIRPSELATDNASSISVVRHALGELELNTGSFCLLQPTSPLRNAEHIREASVMFTQTGGMSVVSACELDHHPLKSLILSPCGKYQPVGSHKDLTTARQRLPKAISPNGAIYFCDISRFNSKPELFYCDTSFYLMSSKNSIDIDRYSDLKRAEEYLSNIECHL